MFIDQSRHEKLVSTLATAGIPRAFQMYQSENKGATKDIWDAESDLVRTKYELLVEERRLMTAFVRGYEVDGISATVSGFDLESMHRRAVSLGRAFVYGNDVPVADSFRNSECPFCVPCDDVHHRRCPSAFTTSGSHDVFMIGSHNWGECGMCDEPSSATDIQSRDDDIKDPHVEVCHDDESIAGVDKSVAGVELVDVLDVENEPDPREPGTFSCLAVFSICDTNYFSVMSYINH